MYIRGVFIRKKKNKSGSTSIHILEKKGNKNVLVKSIGSSSDPAQINQLFQQGQEFIENYRGQGIFDFHNKEETDWFDQSFKQIMEIALVGPEAVSYTHLTLPTKRRV